MENNEIKYNPNGFRGLSVSTILTIVFIVLKLCGVISWSWFWVLSPTIFGLALGLILIIICAIIYCHKEKKK